MFKRARVLCLVVVAALASAMVIAGPAHAEVVTLRGVVGFGPSTPVAGMSVSIWGAARGTVTAADGSYSLVVPKGTASLELSGRYLGSNLQASSRQFVIDGDRTENITLPPPTRLAATVNESDGTPAFDALVRRQAMGVTRTSASGLTFDYSLSDGYCQVPDSGWCDLYFFAGALSLLEITGPGRTTEYFQGETFPVGTVNRTYTLAPSVLLHGSLRRADQQPAPGADVSWDNTTPGYDRTAADGTWSMRSRGGRGRLHIFGDDLGSAQREPYEFESAPFDLMGERTEDLTLPAPARLQTVVRDSVGNEVVGARVAPVGSASVLARSTDSGLGGTFYLPRRGSSDESCETRAGSGSCELSVFRGGVTEGVAVAPQGGSVQQFSIGPTPQDLNTAEVRLAGYATLRSAGSLSGPVLVTTSSTAADFAALTARPVDSADGLDPLLGRIDYRVTVPLGEATRLRVVMPTGTSPNSVLHVGPTGELVDVTADAVLDGSQFDLPVVDGGTGDADGRANGVIEGNVVPVRRDGLSVQTASLPTAIKGRTYEARLEGSGPLPPYSWSALDPLPPGLTLSADGVISGTPTTLGTWTFDVKMRESTGSLFFAVRTLSMTVAPFTVATTTVPVAYAGRSYSTTLKTSSSGFFTWKLVGGALPPGLNLTSGGTISGTPTTAGTYTFDVTATGSGATSPAQRLSLTVKPMEVATAMLPAAPVGATYSGKLTANGGKGTLAWSVVAGALPAGMTLSAAGAITGRPTTVGTSTVTVQVADQSVPKQIATRTLSITVTPMTITTGSLPDVKKGAYYSQLLAVSGGKATLTWSLASGTLPTGLTLSTSGRITGYPKTPGTWTFTVKVVDSSVPKNTATRTLSITVT